MMDAQMKTGCCNRVFLHKEVLKFTLENIRFEIFIRYSSRYVKSAGKRSKARYTLTGIITIHLKPHGNTYYVEKSPEQKSPRSGTKKLQHLDVR